MCCPNCCEKPKLAAFGAISQGDHVQGPHGKYVVAYVSADKYTLVDIQAGTFADQAMREKSLEEIREFLNANAEEWKRYRFRP